ncbi:MAG: glycosyltransferase family 2 protein [Anaerolineae bacterium]|nr:glycosyltransferase family 2 protein [Anaerolineae bacterium]
MPRAMNAAFLCDLATVGNTDTEDGTVLAILMGTRDGERFLRQQLDSIAYQTFGNWHLWVSDDDSRDSTLALLARFAENWPDRVHIRQGPGAGFAANFLSLACDAEINAGYFAYADQDDVWDQGKLSRALAMLRGAPQGVPALYCSRTRLIDAEGSRIGLSKEFPRPLTFANALVENACSGNTLVFNRAARDLLREAGAGVTVVAHDWWTYLLVSGAGGKIVYDHQPSLLYRQHAANAIGFRKEGAMEVARLRGIWHGRYKRWIDANLTGLASMEHRLTPENRGRFECFALSRHKGACGRIAGLLRAGIHRQSITETAGLYLAAALGRI